MGDFQRQGALQSPHPINGDDGVLGVGVRAQNTSNLSQFVGRTAELAVIALGQVVAYQRFNMRWVSDELIK